MCTTRLSPVLCAYIVGTSIIHTHPECAALPDNFHIVNESFDLTAEDEEGTVSRVETFYRIMAEKSLRSETGQVVNGRWISAAEGPNLAGNAFNWKQVINKWHRSDAYLAMEKCTFDTNYDEWGVDVDEDTMPLGHVPHDDLDTVQAESVSKDHGRVFLCKMTTGNEVKYSWMNRALTASLYAGGLAELEKQSADYEDKRGMRDGHDNVLLAERTFLPFRYQEGKKVFTLGSSPSLLVSPLVVLLSISFFSISVFLFSISCIFFFDFCLLSAS